VIRGGAAPAPRPPCPYPYPCPAFFGYVASNLVFTGVVVAIMWMRFGGR
jgi:hypothetical protein